MNPSTEPSSTAPAVVTKRRLFLVDDHPVTRQGVAALINQELDLEVCGEADSAPQALQLIQAGGPDLAVVDITLKTTSGIELLKNLRAVMPDLPVLIMSMHDESLYAERALRAGAKGYIMKHEASARILTAVRQVLAGELFLSDRMKEKMLHRLVKSRKDEVVFSIDTLSDREMEVFQLIGNGYSTRQIAGKLNLSVKTIDSYREHLKLKLRLEKEAKEFKDRMNVFQRVIEWPVFDSKIKFGEGLFKILSEKQDTKAKHKLTSAFMYRILQLVKTSFHERNTIDENGYKVKRGYVDVARFGRNIANMRYLFARNGFSEADIQKLTSELEKELSRSFLTEAFNFDAKFNARDYLVALNFAMLQLRSKIQKPKVQSHRQAGK